MDITELLNNINHNNLVAFNIKRKFLIWYGECMAAPITLDNNSNKTHKLKPINPIKIFFT